MKIVYLDTNLFIALIKSNDEYFPYIEKIISQAHLSFVTSTVTLVELSSVISREYDNLQLDLLFKELEIDRKSDILSIDIILFLIDYMIAKTKTTVIPDPQIEMLNYFPQEFMINPTYKIAILEANKIKLRTLDLIHYSNSFHFNTIPGARIDYIISGDQNFITNGQLYLGIKDFTFVDPETFVKLECS